jgi:hypothetical protein
MSGYLRCGFAVFFLAAGLATPAASNVLTDLLTPNTASEAATAAPAQASTPAPEQCARQPGAPAAGQHWFYRLEGSRKCWYQAAEDSTAAKRAARHRVASRRSPAPDEDAPAPRKQQAVDDARAELVNSAPAQRHEPAPVASAPAQTQESASVPAPAQAAMPPPAPSAPKVTMVHTVPVQVADAAAQVPPALVPTTLGVAQQPISGQPTSDQSRPPQVDVERLLAEAPAASDEVASATPGATMGGSADWMASWLGGLLMALGCAALLSTSSTLRQAIWSVRSSDSRAEIPDITQDGRNEPTFGRIAAALEHDDRTRRALAAALPAQEAFWEEGIGALAGLTSPVSPEGFSGRRGVAYPGVGQQAHWSDS